MCTAVFWLCSLFNFFAVTYSATDNSFVFRHSKLLFVVECLLAVAVSAAVVTVVLVEGGYNTRGIYVVLCVPPTARLMYFTLSLPFTVIMTIGCTLAILIVRRIRKVR